ncbi:MAG: hypothetical protein P1P84_24210 [Deferrisomatales bacterium]|nr:hypothetical protein [Deferrisomatales bacterium]
MSEELSEEIRRDLDRARDLHDRAAADYAQCMEFNQLMADLMDRLEDSGCTRRAGQIMSLLLDCSPKDGARCDKSTLVGDRIKKF